MASNSRRPENAFQVRDPIHGFISLTSLECEIVNTRVFQRLRGIKQLALASLVYPGALHTRFDHSLGVTHVAKLLIAKLLPDADEDAQRLIRFCALLHDVGHGPFSHVSETILDRYSPDVGAKIKEKIHEAVTARIIQKDEQISGIIGRKRCEDVVEMLSGGVVEGLDRGIVSGPLDADKQDYLLRDSYFCGVKYGVFDMQRLISCLRIEENGPETLLAANRDGVSAIEQFVLAKYYMHAQVYRHKVRLITDTMIVRALELGIDRDDLSWLRELYTFEDTEKFLANFLSWDDGRLTTALLYPLTKTDGLATHLFWRLKERRLFKRVFSKNLKEFPEPLFRGSFSKAFKDRDKRRDWETAIAECLSSELGDRIPPEMVILNTYSLKSVREQSRNDESSIIIRDEGSKKPFEEASTLFLSIDEKQKDEFVEVYAPFPFRNKTEQRRLIPKFSQKISEILQKPYKEHPEPPGIHHEHPES